MELHGVELQAILDTIDDAVVAVDAFGLITFFNSAARRLITEGQDAVGKHVTKVIPNTRLLEVLRTGIVELSQQQRINSTTIITNRFPLHNSRGEIVGAVAVFQDVTEVKSLKQQISSLQEVRTLLNAIFDSTQDAISVVDEQGFGILINPAYTRLTGLTEADVLNKPATVDIAEGESVHLRVLQTGEPVKGVPMKVGPKRKEVLVYCSPIKVEGKLRGSVGVIRDVSELRKLSDELEGAKRLIRHLESKYTFFDIIGKSEVIASVIEQATRAALTPATVLLRGESGTGKELFAHAIHHASNRTKGQFIRVNCAALSESILESELFGYVEGAFTGAKRGGKKGLFEEASDGTIFLDEIGEISSGLQSKLLRVLQEKEIVRVGDNRPVGVDVRIIAATNANLEDKIKHGAFREDLYYRLNVFPIYIPPLRQRREDIPLLVNFLIRKFNQEYGRNIEGISQGALESLTEYNWPGNVRELENILGRAIINMRGGENEIEKYHLPLLELTRVNPPIESVSEKYSGQSYQELYQDWEKNLLERVLEQTMGNKTKTAQQLKMSVRNLYYKLEKYGLA
ncbi:MAG TPA: sigma-54-dependent Fis family transcriptional regulator [Candidatus Deferrimicrobium sp.]|nr:sigma-54-dependent Fis family transcriptional regulator [Candidatus Deferrimicrobium sp.]